MSKRDLSCGIAAMLVLFTIACESGEIGSSGPKGPTSPMAAGAGGDGGGGGEGAGSTDPCEVPANPDVGLPESDGPEAPPADVGPPADPMLGQSVQSGAWSDPSTWHAGVVPGSTDPVIVSAGHTVTLDVDASAAGVLVEEGALLRFDQDASAALESSENVIVEGTLEMRPSASSHVHALRFLGIDENAFQGGGLDPLPSDVGLWVMHMGKLSVRGTSKTSWTRLEASAGPGDTSFSLEHAPVGWEVGDEIVVVPTDTPGDDAAWDDATGKLIDPFHAKFERRKIASIEGSAVTVDAPLAHAHDQVIASDGGKKWTAEVANLTRNARIEGTAGGRAHVFIRSHMLQKIAYLEGRYLGPRKSVDGGRPGLVLGRYALHFHHCMDGSQGSWVHGSAIHDTGNRVYVPHMSDGVTMRRNVAFNSMEAAFWWDFQEISHDILYEGNLMALISMNGVDAAQSGMVLNMGDGNVARGNVAVYASGGDVHSRGAYEWNSNSEGIWTFEDNLAHSSAAGIFVWQNTAFNHVIHNYESYNNRLGIMHGAYVNTYTYRYGYHYNSPVEVKATSGNSNGVIFDSIVFDAGGQAHPVLLQDSPSPGHHSNKWIRCDFRNYTTAGVRLYSTMPSSNAEKQFKHGDLILCTFDGEAFSVDPGGSPAPGPAMSEPLLDGNRVRVQPVDGPSYQVEIVGGQPVKTDIDPFAPIEWGQGDGLFGEYFSGSSFESLAFSRVDPVVLFEQWSPDKNSAPFGVHHLLTGDAFSIRWTGELEAQVSGAHVFSVQGAGGARLWIDGVQVLDSWTEQTDNDVVVTSNPVDLVAGKRHAIKLEHFNAGGARGCRFFWTPPGGEPALIPQSQAYSGVAPEECAH